MNHFSINLGLVLLHIVALFLTLGCKSGGGGFKGAYKRDPIVEDNNSGKSEDDSEEAEIPENVTGIFLKLYKEKEPSEGDPNGIHGVVVVNGKDELVSDLPFDLRLNDLSSIGVEAKVEPSLDGRYHALIIYSGKDASTVSNGMNLAQVVGEEKGSQKTITVKGTIVENPRPAPDPNLEPEPAPDPNPDQGQAKKEGVSVPPQDVPELLPPE